MISGWMIQQSCQTLQTPLFFSSQLKKSGHLSPEAATPDILLQGLKGKGVFAQLSLLLWFSAALGAALFTTQWPASTGFEDNSLPYNID